VGGRTASGDRYGMFGGEDVGGGIGVKFGTVARGGCRHETSTQLPLLISGSCLDGQQTPHELTLLGGQHFPLASRTWV
jgi:hypothetical protein